MSPGFSPLHCINQAWWCIPVIPVLGRVEQESQEQEAGTLQCTGVGAQPDSVMTTCRYGVLMMMCWVLVSVASGVVLLGDRMNAKSMSQVEMTLKRKV